MQNKKKNSQATKLLCTTSRNYICTVAKLNRSEVIEKKISAQKERYAKVNARVNDNEEKSEICRRNCGRLKEKRKS